jgi:hypothetical protein
MALRENPWLGRETVIMALETVDFNKWRKDAPGLQCLDPPVLIRENIGKCNIIHFAGTYYLLPQTDGAFLPNKAENGAYQHLLQDQNLERLMERLEYATVSPGPSQSSFASFVSWLRGYWDK